MTNVIVELLAYVEPPSGMVAVGGRPPYQWKHGWEPLTPEAMAQKAGKQPTGFKVPTVGDPDLDWVKPSEAKGNKAVRNPFYVPGSEEAWEKDQPRVYSSAAGRWLLDQKPGDPKDPRYLTKEQAEKYLPVRKVDPRLLIHTQSWVRPIDPDFATKAGREHIREGEKKPVVYRSPDGKLYLQDGHHRVLMALERGDRSIEVFEQSQERFVPRNAAN